MTLIEGKSAVNLPDLRLHVVAGFKCSNDFASPFFFTSAQDSGYSSDFMSSPQDTPNPSALHGPRCAAKRKRFSRARGANWERGAGRRRSRGNRRHRPPHREYGLRDKRVRAGRVMFRWNFGGPATPPTCHPFLTTRLAICQGRMPSVGLPPTSRIPGRICVPL